MQHLIDRFEEWRRDVMEYDGDDPDDVPVGPLVLYKIVCPDCDGKGTTWLGRPAHDAIVFTGDEWNEMDYEERDDWMGGFYDGICPECNGKNVVDEVNRDHTSPEVLKAWDEWINDYYDMRAAERMERMMGA